MFITVPECNSGNLSWVKLTLFFCSAAMQVVRPKLPSSNVQLCPHPHNATVVPTPQKSAAKVGPQAKKAMFRLSCDVK